jgi:hypothetical protein
MGLELGRTFDRSYNMRIPFTDGFFNLGVFFSKRSPFVLFRIDPDFRTSKHESSIKISMFKSLDGSKFCETFVNLHNFRKNTLDILNQFHSIKNQYSDDVNFIFNETLNLAKVESDDKVFYDTLTLYGFTLTSFSNDFVFVIAERQNIIKKLSKKLVRTTGLQIATTPALNLLEEFYNESKISGKEGLEFKTFPDAVIKLDENK